MLRLTFILIFLVCFDLCMYGQNRKEKGSGIWNEITDLKVNRVYSVTITEFLYSTKGKKENSKYEKTENVIFYDSLGRETEKWYYNHITGQLSSKNKSFYSDTSEHYNRLEWYNDKDILTNECYAKEMVSAKASMQFGYYKYTYSDKGLINEAVYYENKCPTCSKVVMTPVYLYKLKYIYR